MGPAAQHAASADAGKSNERAGFRERRAPVMYEANASHGAPAPSLSTNGLIRFPSVFAAGCSAP
jgi:hypothetical protein